MNRLAGPWLAVGLAVAAMAGSVLYAARVQQTAAETNFGEAQNASSMLVAVLQQERGLDGFLGSRRSAELQPYFEGKRTLASTLALARELSSDDPEESSLVARQEAIASRWQRASTIELASGDPSQAHGSVESADARSDGLITQFEFVNAAYQARLATLRKREEGRAALIPVWLVFGLSVLFGGAGWVFNRRTHRAREEAARVEREARKLELGLAATAGRFAEALQVSESQTEAHAVIAHHLEGVIADSEVVVLNRNNSADRLESTMALAEDHPLSVPLQDSRPRSCLAVRLSRQYERGPGEVLSCSLCGSLTDRSTCRPLLVGGEVIGSVLVVRDRPLTVLEDRLLVESVAQASPVLANLRNLAFAETRAATDALTGLPNRRAVDGTLKRMLARASRADLPFSAVLLDLDHFKKINDTYGHDRGDEVLAAFGALLQAELRESDLAGRTGGEEFVLLLPDTDRAGGVALAEKVRVALHRLRVRGVSIPITASFGVASFPEDAVDAATLFRIADRALYSAKRQGRDRVETPASTTAPAASDRPEDAALIGANGARP